MISLISKKYNNRISLHLKQVRQYVIRRRWEGIKNHDFSMISSNCIGSRIYEELHIPYRTPTVGLFFLPEDYIQFTYNLNHYLSLPLEFTEISKHQPSNDSRQRRWYPIGVLGDIEVHFLHYHNNLEAVEKWERRKKRINWERMFFVFTDQGDCTYEHLEMFDRLPYPNKVCFVASKYPELKSCVTIPAFAGQKAVGNLYMNYDLFLGVFNFTRWINQGAPIPELLEVLKPEPPTHAR